LLLLVPLVLGIVFGFVAGGRGEGWQHLELRWPWLIVAALVIREGVVLTPLNRIEWLRFVYIGFMAVLVAWTVWHVKRLPGAWLVSAGAALNLIVMVANGARMPVAAAAAKSLVQAGHSGQYTLMDANTNLAWLGDWIAVLGAVYSPGDVIVGLGIGVVAFVVTRRRTAGTKLDDPTNRMGSIPP
jgi:hypothetical protein